MLYRIEFSNSAAKELQLIYKADSKLYSRLITVVESLKSDPFQGKRLKGIMSGDYSLRIGNYRIIYIVYKDKLLVSIIDLGHRREIYR